MTRLLVTVSVAALVACGSSSSDEGGENRGGAGAGGSQSGAGQGGSSGDAGTGASGAMLRFSGTASADIDSSGAGAGELPAIDRVECNFYGEILDRVDDDAGGFSGVAIGEVFRNLYAGDQRFEFSALIGGPATLTALPDDRVELRAFGDQTGAKPFWRALEVLEARETEPDRFEGTWTCASLDLAEPGFPDIGHEAEGAWELAPGP